MKASFQASFQIGKNGLTPGVINSLVLALKKHKQVRISVLKSASRNKAEISKIAQEIEEKIPKTKSRILGFTIILKK
jgi:RNA-binding protein YhbY